MSIFHRHKWEIINKQYGMETISRGMDKTELDIVIYTSQCKNCGEIKQKKLLGAPDKVDQDV